MIRHVLIICACSVWKVKWCEHKSSRKFVESKMTSKGKNCGNSNSNIRSEKACIATALVKGFD